MFASEYLATRNISKDLLSIGRDSMMIKFSLGTEFVSAHLMQSKPTSSGIVANQRNFNYWKGKRTEKKKTPNADQLGVNRVECWTWQKTRFLNRQLAGHSLSALFPFRLCFFQPLVVSLLDCTIICLLDYIITFILLNERVRELKSWAKISGLKLYDYSFNTIHSFLKLKR